VDDRIQRAEYLIIRQLIVVGDQSTGKSSVLESLTGFSFPRATGLCTRYATQITCRREVEKSVIVSIIPRADAGESLKKRLLDFQHRVAELDNVDIVKIFEEVHTVAQHILTLDTDQNPRQLLLWAFEGAVMIKIPVLPRSVRIY
jgi:GTPase SAR1 family protein